VNLFVLPSYPANTFAGTNAFAEPFVERSPPKRALPPSLPFCPANGFAGKEKKDQIHFWRAVSKRDNFLE
jgi:hypothetical protein